MEFDVNKISIGNKAADVDVSKIAISGKSKKRKELEQKIGFDSIDADLKTVGNAINNAYSGWQDADTMKNIRQQATKMQERLSALDEYNKRYGGNNSSLSETLASYTNIVNGWGERANEYAKYENKEDYDKAVKERKEYLAQGDINLGELAAEINNLEKDKETAKLAFSNFTDFTYKGGATEDVVKAKEFHDQANKYKKQYENILNQHGYKNIEELDSAIYDLQTKYKNAEHFQKYAVANVDELNTELEGLETTLKKAQELFDNATNVAAPTNAQRGNINNEAAKSNEELIQYLAENGYNNIYELQEEIEQKKQFRDEAARTQGIGQDSGWWKSGAFDDGWDFGDLTKTIVATGADVLENVNTAVLEATENLIDTSAYVLGAIGAISENDARTFIAQDFLNTKRNGERMREYLDFFTPLIVDGNIEDYSVLADKADGLVQSGAHLVGQAALQRVGVPYWLTGGVNAFGSEIEGAFQQGAKFDEAGTSGLATAAAEVLSEKLFGGIVSKTGLDDIIAKKFSGYITNTLLRKLYNWGFKPVGKAAGEGFEEVLSEAMSTLGRKMTYESDKTWAELFTSEEALENYIDAFMGGALLGGLGANVENVTNYVNQSQLGQNIVANGGENLIIETALKLDPKTYAYKLANSANLSSNANIGEIALETQKAVSEAQRKDFERIFEREAKNQGASKSQAKKIANALVENTLSANAKTKMISGDEYKIYKSVADNIVNDVNLATEISQLSQKYDVMTHAISAAVNGGEIETFEALLENIPASTPTTETDTASPSQDTQGENVLASPEGEEAVDTKGLGFTEPSEKEIRRPLTYEEQIDEVSGRKKTAQMRHIDDLAKKLDKDLKVLWVDPNDNRLSGNNGVYIRDTNTMILSNKLSTVEAYTEVFKHEFVHRLETKKAYQGFKNYLFNKSQAFEEYAISRLQLHDGKIRDNRDDAINDLIQMYIDNFKKNKAIPQNIRDNFTKEKAEKEAVADFVARTLFKGNTAQLRVALKTDTAALQAVETDLKLIEELARDDRNLFQKIIDAIKDFIASIKGIPQFRQLEEDLAYIEQRLSRVYNSRDVGKGESGVVYAKELNEDLNQEGIEYDEESESVFSADSWEDSAYVKDREATAKKLADALGISKKKALDYIKDIDGIANTILADYARLGYVPSPDRSAFVSNAEYGGSIDMSTLCAKRRWLTGTFSAIQKALNHTALTANEILEIRNMLKAKGIEVSCGLCYVEGSRAQMGKFAKEFIERYKKRNPDWIPDMADVNTPEGVEQMRLNHPDAYEAYEQFWNNKGVLNEGEKNLFASQQKPKLYQLRTDYKHEILDKFSSEGNVVEKNKNGGMRIQSFSDFEIVHLIDMMQVIIDMSQVGLHGQAYTKVPEFALALGNTGLKINLSLIAKDVDANGNLVFDDVEGMPFETAMNIRNMYSKNVGTVLVVFNDAQLKAALKDSRIDFVLPFHRSQWKKAMYADLGLPSTTKDYTYVQNERYIKPVYYTTRNGTIGKRKATNYMPNEYWDFSKSGKENAENYLKMCAENNKRPKFYKLLVDNGNGSYSLQPDGSTDGYWKLLIDFKMYDNEGKGSKQTPVKPDFNMEECYKMLENYEGGHEKFPVNQEVVDEFVGKYMKEHGEKGFKEKTKADANAPTTKYDVSFSGDYWYPRMSKSDLQRVRNIAKYEVNNDKNYIDNITKWLYNDRGQKTYFAIYSTEHPENPTILYACNGNRAINEHDLILDYYLEVDVENGKNNDTKPRTVEGLLEVIESARQNRVSNNNNVVGRTSNGGNVGLHSRNKRTRPSEALLNCLKNRREISGNGRRGNVSYSSDDLTATHRSLLDRYEQGEITKDEYLAEMDSIYGQAVETYGAMPKGEYNETDMPTPNAVAEDKPTERFARTFVGAAKLTPEMVNEFEKDMLLGKFSYKVASDDKAVKTAEKVVSEGEGEKVWESLLNKGGFPTKNDIAIGEKLLTDAIDEGDTLKTMQLASELADIFTRAGQVVQAARLLGKMTGAGRLVSAQRFVDSLNTDIRKKNGVDARKIKIDPKLAELLTTAEGQRAIEQAYREIMKNVAEQMPPTFLDKWNAWRYFAMLSNPKTHVRNLVGNTIFIPSVRLKDTIAAGLEKAIKVENGTKVVKVKKEYRDFAKNDAKKSETQALIKGGKYDDAKNEVNKNRKTFETKWLEGTTSFVFNALETEDMWFKNIHYVHALGSFLQARKVDLSNVSEEVLTEARAYAIKEAKKATFNDANELATAIQKLSDKNMFTKLAVEGILPFKRTPLNIIRRGVEYSPIGLVTSLTKGIYDVKKGKITASELIDGVASGMTGTILMGLGWLIASLGFASGGSDDEDKAWYEKLLGGQNYAITIGDHSYTIDWTAPSAIPFFMGVELSSLAEEGFSLGSVLDVMGSSLEPLINLSALQGVQDAINSARYADESELLTSMLFNTVQSYTMQNIPSFVGAIARSWDSKQRSWYVDKNSNVPKFAQDLWNEFRSKIPGLTQTMPEKIDAWGREVSRGSVGERIAENFISPGYYSEKNYTDVDRELERLYDKTKEASILPKTAPKYFSVDGKRKDLTAEEYVTFAKAKGQYSFEYVEEFINHSEYDKLTDEQKAAVISNLYEYAGAKAKTTVSSYDLMKTYKVVTLRERSGGSAVDYYIKNQKKK